MTSTLIMMVLMAGIGGAEGQQPRAGWVKLPGARRSEYYSPAMIAAIKRPQRVQSGLNPHFIRNIDPVYAASFGPSFQYRNSVIQGHGNSSVVKPILVLEQNGTIEPVGAMTLGK